MLGWKKHKLESRLPGEISITSDTLSCIGEGNGNPLQCSCLENPRDRGAWWAAIYESHRVGHDWSDLAARAIDNILSHILWAIVKILKLPPCGRCQLYADLKHDNPRLAGARRTSWPEIYGSDNIPIIQETRWLFETAWWRQSSWKIEVYPPHTHSPFFFSLYYLLAKTGKWGISSLVQESTVSP